MKITFSGATARPKSYSKGGKLRPNTFYEDDDGDLVITDWIGEVSAVVVKSTNEVYGPDAASWPLRETTVKSITITR